MPVRLSNQQCLVVQPTFVGVGPFQLHVIYSVAALGTYSMLRFDIYSTSELVYHAMLLQRHISQSGGPTQYGPTACMKDHAAIVLKALSSSMKSSMNTWRRNVNEAAIVPLPPPQ